MKYILLIVLLVSIPASASAIDKAGIEANLPGVKIKKVNPSPISGLFEILTKDNQIFYVDESGKYMFYGNIIDLNSRVNITEQRVESLNKVDFKNLPLKNAIRTGKGKNKIAVFHDPDCPFCRKLYVELKKLKNVEVYNFIFFLPQLHPAAYEKAKKVYCSKDPINALDDLMTGRGIKNLKACDTDIVDRNAKLAQEVGVRGTPHIILENGTSIRGYRSVEYIQDKIASMSKK